MNVTAPVCIADKLRELDALCAEYPLKIPIEAAAHFLGIGGQSLRAMIESRRCPFGLGWLQENAQNRAFYIPTLTFYLWLTNPAGMMFQKQQ